MSAIAGTPKLLKQENEYLRAEVERLRAQKATLICDGCRRLGEVAEDNEQLRALLEEARQYVSDAGNDEDVETQHLSGQLLTNIDAALESKSS